MPIKAATMMDIREQIARMALSGQYTIVEIANLFGVSRPTVYQYRDRYEAGGREELIDRSRAPVHPRRIAETIRDRVLNERRRFGSKKIRQRMNDEDPEGNWPARSTIDSILSDSGMVKRRRPVSAYRSPFRTEYVPSEPSEMATIDFKGEFRLRNGRWCHPLTMADAVSRFVLACEALPSIELAGVWPVVERVFREHGLPKALKSDNGPPFGTHGVGRLSLFSVRLMALGIQPVFSRPGHPEDNGSHERMHRTFKEHMAQRRGRSMHDQQKICDDFRLMYNHERPHEGIDMRRPGNVHRSSPRAFPAKPPKIEYGSDLHVARVMSNGAIKYRGNTIFIAKALSGQRIALQVDEHDLCDVYFGSFLIGKIDTNKRRFC